jgi:hypothetical protein
LYSRICKKYSTTNKPKRSKHKIKSLLQKCHNTNFTIHCENKSESIMSNSSVPQPVNIVDLLCMYKSYILLKNISNSMLMNDRLILNKLLSICDTVINYISDVTLLNSNDNFNNLFEKLKGYLS